MTLFLANGSHTYQGGLARLGPINAIGRFLFGLSHDDSHLEQLREIMRQARAARAAAISE